ncbi:uncharacterized protein LOC110982342 [Acanthaster planci]|uniref:Uncharacterized protein LOC110982342 n=1 Tax=Acanthaster planci TaxID=133434 RepID=A0A8B7YV56_ACAPL|nr:uncharacterized protein LOC110982342 [Acanthaster planci]
MTVRTSVILSLLLTTLLVNTVSADEQTAAPTERNGSPSKNEGENSPAQPGQSTPKMTEGSGSRSGEEPIRDDGSAEQSRPRRQTAGGHPHFPPGYTAGHESLMQKYHQHIADSHRWHSTDANRGKGRSLQAGERQKQVFPYAERRQIAQPRKYRFDENKVGHRVTKTRVHFTPLGVAAPVGPIREEKRLQRTYSKYFTKDDEQNKFLPPKHLLRNCWMQAMVARSFSPSCKEDGTYSAKQCHKKRCWCSNKHGKMVNPSGKDRDHGVYFGIKALTLRCST